MNGKAKAQGGEDGRLVCVGGGRGGRGEGRGSEEGSTHLRLGRPVWDAIVIVYFIDVIHVIQKSPD